MGFGVQDRRRKSGGTRVLNTNTVSDFVNSFLFCVLNGSLVFCLFASLQSCSCARFWPLFSILCSVGTLLRQRGRPTFPQVLPPSPPERSLGPEATLASAASDPVEAVLASAGLASFLDFWNTARDVLPLGLC